MNLDMDWYNTPCPSHQKTLHVKTGMLKLR